VIEEENVDDNVNRNVVSKLAKQIGSIHAPVGMFPFF